MRLSFTRTIVVVAVFTLLLTGSIFASTNPPSAGAPGDALVSYLSVRASTLLAEIQEEAAKLTPHTETLQTYSWTMGRSWQSHAKSLRSVKDHVNSVGERLAELQRIREYALPWQQQAITEVTSHAAQVAASTQAAILHLRENRDRLFVQEYRDHLRTIGDRSRDMKQAVDKFLDYEKAMQKLQRLQGELEIGKV